MKKDDGNDEHEDLPDKIQRKLEKVVLVSRTINELASESSLFNVVSLIDGEQFTDPLEASRFGKCGIVWFIPKFVDSPQEFESQFCTAIGPKPDLEFGEKEDLDTDRLSDNARLELLEKVNKSDIGKKRSVYECMERVRSALSGATANRVSVCVIASYNVLDDDTITLLAFHPCIDPRAAIELWWKEFKD
ncbi:MAG: hypothetical protein AAB649_06275 [Patescibacteria group bacterium]